jgi:hypothetical protein
MALPSVNAVTAVWRLVHMNKIQQSMNHMGLMSKSCDSEFETDFAQFWTSTSFFPHPSLCITTRDNQGQGQRQTDTKTRHRPCRRVTPPENAQEIQLNFVDVSRATVKFFFPYDFFY